MREGRGVGSELVGQQFNDLRYFWGRPSATADHPDNPIAGAGSNLGPPSPALKKAIASRMAALWHSDPSNTAPIPVDLVTASASGLNPHISPAAAAYQVGRVARVRGLSVEAVRALVAAATEPPQWGFLGEPRVNVLQLNLSLDLKPSGQPPS